MWTMVENNLPTTMGHAPWDGVRGRKSLSNSAKAAIKEVALLEVSQDMDAQANLDSMYFSGKVSPSTGIISLKCKSNESRLC